MSDRKASVLTYLQKTAVKRLLCSLFTCLITLAGLTCIPDSRAQQPPPETAALSQPELDQLLAPIALYPDPLLSQVLMAATYPLEVVQAARFVQQNPGLAGDGLAQAAAQQPWDASVKSLLQFPTVLSMMDDQLEWTQRLGDAFLAQQAAVMDTVQALRAKALADRNLNNTPQQSVQMQGGAIDINPNTPDTIYVPYYDPTQVYGPWWWPDYQPFVWLPPANYGYVPAGGIAFGSGVGIIGPLFIFSRPNWSGHNFITYPGQYAGGAGVGQPGGNAGRGRPGWTWPQARGTVWAHDPNHRLGVTYRDAATRNQFQPLWSNNNANVRDAYRGHVSTVPSNLPSSVPAAPTAYPKTPPMRQQVEPVHPMLPTGPAAVVQSNAERGRESRAASNKNPPARADERRQEH